MGTKYLSVAEVADRLRVSKMTVYRLVHNAELVSVRVGRSVRIPEPAYEDFLSDNTKSGPQALVEVAS